MSVSKLMTGFAVLTVCFLARASAGEIEKTAVLRDLFGENGAANFADILPADHEFEFEIYTPEPADASSPPGVVVFVSPSPEGEIPDDLKKAFDQHNLIWIAAKGSGNKRPVYRRIAEALASAIEVQREFVIDPERLYIAGFSGGGRVTSYVSMFYPDAFAGSVFICGVNSFEEEPNAMLDRMKQNRFVFLTGAEDFNRRETSLRYNEYKDAGFEHIKLMVVPGMGHSMPSAAKFGEAIEFLDARESTP